MTGVPARRICAEKGGVVFFRAPGIPVDFCALPVYTEKAFKK
jgi:hypothetical protein